MKGFCNVSTIEIVDIFSLSLSCLLLLSYTADNLGKNKQTRTALDVELTYGHSSPAIGGIIPSISETGNQVYLFYPNVGASSIFGLQPVAQLYNNVDGKLVPAVPPLNTETALQDAWTGHGSRDFSRFSVILSDHISKMVIRLYDQSFNIIAKTEFIDPGFETIDGGTFSEDGNYLIFTYSVFTGVNTAETKIYILDTRYGDLPVVVSTTITGIDYVNGDPTLFTLKDCKGNKKLYFTFMNSQIDTTTFTLLPPYFSQVYAVNPDEQTITLAASHELPQIAETDVLVRNDERDAFIAHGGFCSLFKHQHPRIYDVVTPSITSNLKHDNAEARIFKFDGRELHTILKQSVNCCNRTAFFPMGNGCSAFFGQNTDLYVIPGDISSGQAAGLEFWCLAETVEGKSGLEFRPLNLPRSDMGANLVAFNGFSRDGNWFIRTGYYGYLDCTGDVCVPCTEAAGCDPNRDTYGIHNILLFKVKSTEYKSCCNPEGDSNGKSESHKKKNKKKH